MMTTTTMNFAVSQKPGETSRLPPPNFFSPAKPDRKKH